MNLLPTPQISVQRAGITPRRYQHVVLAVILLIAGVSLFSARASANVSHVFTKSFGTLTSTPADPYPLSGPTDVEVDQRSGDVYVTDPGNHRIEKFSASGEFLIMFGKDVNATSGGNICPESPSDVCQAGASSSSPGAFEDPHYLAVDNTSGPSKGDVYVGDTGNNIVQKFDSSGHLITSWGVEGQKNGADATDLPVYGPLFGIAVGGPEDNLYVGGTHYSYNVWKYSQDGTYEGPYRNTSGIPWLKADEAGDLFFAGTEGFFGPQVVSEQTPITGSVEYNGYQVGTATPVAGFALDPSTGELYQNTGTLLEHYSPDCNPPVTGPCNPIDSFGSGKLSGAEGVAVDGSTHAVYVANSTGNSVADFGDARPIVTTEHPTGVSENSVTLTGSVDPAERGNITECHFEYGFTKSYGHILPCVPNPEEGEFSKLTDVAATIPNLSPGTTDHYRVVATNSAGATSDGVDETFITTQPPAVEGMTATNLTANSADLVAQINPNGEATEYQFEYGPGIEYGQVAPVVIGENKAAGEENPITEKLNSDHEVEVELKNLIPHAVYHYRLRATNQDGTTKTVDHTFNFYPPSCPNENVRQQVQANYLPDCRAYELVSPGDANGTQLYPGGPNSGYATNPSRFSYTGLWSTIPNSGGSPIDGNGDLYVATRTDSGWVTKYVGLPANQAAVDGGPPQGLYGQGGPQFLGNDTSIANGDSGADTIQNNVLTDPSMEKFVDWNDGSQEGAGENPTPIASNAPFVWSSEGELLDRWPSNLSTVPDGSYPPGSNVWPTSEYVAPGEQPLSVAPGGIHSLDCPAIGNAGSSLDANDCPGEVNASSDLSHFVFSTEWNIFAPGGTLSPPGSAYDNNTATGTVTVASKTPAGEDIPNEPGDQTGDPLQIPAVSTNGSHILLAASGTGPCGLAHCPTPPCGGTFGGKIHCPSYPSDLYIRVDGDVTYDVSEGHDVTYVGMTPDGSKVYFTTPEQLNAEDHDSSIDLYMWSEAGEKAGHPLTLISKGDNPGNSGEPGNSDACSASFTTNCGVVTYSNIAYCQLTGGEGGNCLSDNSIASENGDIYFFSPEQLDGSRGILDQENMYVYHEGHVEYVTTLTTGPHCFESPVEGFTDEACSSTPVARMQVSPDDGHMAFATASPVTQYDNAGHLEMYEFEPSTEKLVCASCIPDGEPPTSDIAASQDGLFMTNDGRVFFTTNDALVHGDTNHAIDVYEYTNGRAQLITPGTGETAIASGVVSSLLNPPGLIGVSAEGKDVYFSTYDTLVPQDHNGLFLKMYDARSDGGFPAPAPPPPCEAADECHGAGSSPPNGIQNGTSTPLGDGGSVVRSSSAKQRKKRARAAERRRHQRSQKRHNRRTGRGRRG